MEYVIEYSLVHAYYPEAFPYIVCCAYVNSCLTIIIEPQLPVPLLSQAAFYENKKGSCNHGNGH